MNSIEKVSEVDRPCGKSLQRILNRPRRFRMAAAVCTACVSLFLLQPPLIAAEPGTLLSFLKIAGINGESDSKGHKDEIDTLGFATGIDLPTPASGGQASKPQFFEVIVSKNVDKASPLLFISCATGKLFPTATLTMAKASTAGPVDFFKITLTNATITRVETKGMTGSGGALSEEVSLSFQKIQWSITTFDAKGVPTVTTRGFDLTKNVQF